MRGVLTRHARCAACGTSASDLRTVAFRKDGFEIVRCPTCGLLSRSELPERNEVARIYDMSYFRDHGGEASDGYADYLGDEDLHRAHARRRLALLRRFVSSVDRRLLDVGAAAGFFVDEAGKAGWEAQGIDVSAEMVSWGRSHLDARLSIDTLQSLPAESGPFSTVTMWDYIEHALDPAADLERSRDLLLPGGVLALSTGDADSAVARVSGGRWHLLTPRDHNFFFTARTMRRLLERVGLDVLYLRHLGARYSLQHLAYKLDRMVRVDGTDWLARRAQSVSIGRLAIPVNLFDIMTVIARRP